MRTEDSNIYHQQAEHCRLNGDMNRALKLYQKSAQLSPLSAPIQSDLGNMYREMNQVDAALKQYLLALKLNPNLATASNNLGLILAESQQITEAIAYFKQAIHSEPHYINAYHNLAQAYLTQSRWEELIACEEKALAINPNHPIGQFLMGYALASLKNYSKAIIHYQQAIQLQPQFHEAYQAMGRALLSFKHWKEADQLFNYTLRQKRGIPWNEGPPEATPENPCGLQQRQLSPFELRKLQHDLEQINHLIEHNYLSNYLSQLKEIQHIYSQTLAQLQLQAGQVSPHQLRELNRFWGKNIYIHPLPLQSENVLNPIDSQSIEAIYRNSKIGFVSFDNLLKPTILNLLYEFSLTSTIWHDYMRSENYLAAYDREGLSQPFLYQIGTELQTHLPTIFNNLPLLKMWIYKNNQHPIGVRTHADCAAINVVIWLTPDEANLDPNSGGLILYDVEAPESMSDDEVNQFALDQTQLNTYLKQHMTSKHRIPYRQNRVTIFNSDLYHETDHLNFKTGYRHRRVNLNLVFGHRGD